MLKDITLGQFFPGDTLAHKLDPRTKLIAVVLYIAALFTANNWSAQSSSSRCFTSWRSLRRRATLPTAFSF